ncbi:MAG: sigma-70 family RNA polymerase sigma factor [Paludibacter sp.]|nr:sigma-70 family RNA polymerase sigma factor [Paludibacter sp.]
MSNTDDIRWITQLTLLGDKSAFDKLTCKYQSPIRRFFLNLTVGDSQLSDDLAQETFIKAYLNISSFKGISGFSTWLYRIAYNVYYDSVRARKYYADIDEQVIDSQYQTQNEFSAEKMDIYKALNLLRKEEQTAVLLFYMEDKTHKEIAKIMNCPLGTVKTYILKGKERLSVYLTKQGYGNK